MQREHRHVLRGQLTSFRVRKFLEDRFGGVITDVDRIAYGEWSKAFGFRRDGASYVVKFNPIGDDFLKDRRAMQFSSPDLPIRRIVDIGQAFGGFYAIVERASGSFLDTLDGEGLRRHLPALFAMLDAARRVDLSSSFGYGIWTTDGNAPHPSWRDALLSAADDPPNSRTHGWRDQLANSPTGPEPFERAYARLREMASACPTDRHLIHSDLLNYNVFVSDNRISAVLDWGNSMYGDFLFDIAWFTFWQPWYPAWHGIDLRAAAQRHFATIGLDVPDLELRMRCYEIFIGLDGQAYQAFTRRWDDLAATARRTLAIATA